MKSITAFANFGFVRLAAGVFVALALAVPPRPLVAYADVDRVPLGRGAYYVQPKGSDPSTPAAKNLSGAMLNRAVPTNQWYSNLIFQDEPGVIFATPLTVKPAVRGFEMALPDKKIAPTVRGDVEVQYPHTNPLIFKPSDFTPERVTLADASDWAVDIEMSAGVNCMRASVAHGSPFVYFELNAGDLVVQVPRDARRIAGVDERVLAVMTGGKAYAVFGPTGVLWRQNGPDEWRAVLPAAGRYFSAAALPDAQAATIQSFLRHAYVFVRGTKAEWRYEQQASLVSTRFTVATRVMEGEDNGPLLGLYPHQWFNNPSVSGRLIFRYDSIRGPIRLLAAKEFSTARTYTGILPYWPGVRAPDHQKLLDEVLKTDVRQGRSMLLPMGEGPYWQGKGLQRITQLMSVVEQQGDTEGRERLLNLAKGRFEEWLSGDSRRKYFSYDKQLGTVVGYPEEYFCVRQMNDHHFHYGYWIRAAADIALRDPAWGRPDQWGGMIDLLVNDIATDQRGRKDFPFLRNFDIYEGHSWASGIAQGTDGNNQESSSEAVNAWSGLILWGALKGDVRLRDLGIWLYTSEIESVQHYWFDLNKLVLAPEYLNVEVSMLFGGKYSHNTWWTDEPRQIHGINLLPLTTASLYLARDPGFIEKNLAAMNAESSHYRKRVDPPDIWNDIFMKYLALANPQKALGMWTRWGTVEMGDTRTHTLHWLQSLQEHGRPVLDVTANIPFYSVFRQSDGTTSYLVYNYGTAPLEVLFSDSTRVSALPNALTVVRIKP